MKLVSKKLISVLLALVLVLGSAVVAFAAIGDFNYDVLDDGTGAITVFNGTIEDGVFTIDDEDELLELPLTAVADEAFAYDGSNPDLAFLDDVTSIIVEEGIALIGDRAFADLPALESVEFKGDVKLGEEAFAGCANLKSVTFDGDAYLGAYAFKDCTALEELNNNDGAAFDAEVGALNDTAWFNNYTVDFVTVGTTLIAYKGADEEETIPLNITAIGASAFEGNQSLKKIVLTKYVEKIGNKAFADSALEEVVFSDTGKITEIGEDAFLNTPFFNNYEGEFFIIDDILIKYMGDDVSFVQIPNTVKEIADGAFDGCYTYNEKDGYSFVISSILVPASVTKLGENCFALATFEDGSTYSPRIYAYAGTPAADALKEAGYLVTDMPKIADVDGDGKVTAADARAALRIAVKLDPADDIVKAAADVDGDGQVTANDARTILRIAVQLEEIDSEDLLYMPRTDVEILNAFTAAMKKAAVEKVSYTKTVSNTITKADVNLQHKSKITAIASKNAVNSKNTYESDTQAAVDNIIIPKLLSTANIKSATSLAKDGKYYLTIVFDDVEDAYITLATPDYTPSTSYLTKVMPVVNGQVFYDAISANSWFKLVDDSDNRTLNCVRKYALTYTNPTVTAVIDAETGKIESATLSLVYRFAVDGRVNGVDISSKGFKTGDGVVERTDKISYTNFGW
jgi:hypothetical protein